jgi:hypothetical protein
LTISFWWWWTLQRRTCRRAYSSSCLVRKDWQPLGFFSKKLEAAQQKYSAFDRELFACYSGIRHFRYLLDGRRFAIFTDHKLLTYALARVSGPWTAHQSRQLSYMAEYTSDIRHIVGAANVVADTLSRPPVIILGCFVYGMTCARIT